MDIKEILGLGLNNTYDIVKSSGFPSIKIGKRYLVPQIEFEKWLEKNVYKEYTYTKSSSFFEKKTQQSGSKSGSKILTDNHFLNPVGKQEDIQSGSKSGSKQRVRRKKALKIKGL